MMEGDEGVGWGMAAPIYCAVESDLCLWYKYDHTVDSLLYCTVLLMLLV